MASSFKFQKNIKKDNSECKSNSGINSFFQQGIKNSKNVDEGLLQSPIPASKPICWHDQCTS